MPRQSSGASAPKSVSFKQKRVLLFFFLFTLHAVMGYSQELRFVQSFASPLLLNPALTGDIPGRYRINLLHRNQWSPALGAPIVSYTFEGDAKFQLPGRGDYFGLGILFFSDRFATYQTHINQMSVSLSYHRKLNARNHLQAGIHFGVSQRGVNYENFTFEDQFDGVNKYNQPSGETLPPNSLAQPELAFGLQYKNVFDKGRVFYIGASGHHLIRSQVSYYSQIEENNVPFSKDNALFRRYHLYAGMVLHQSAIRYTPSVKFMSQGPIAEVAVGGTVRKQFYDSRLSAVHFGAWLTGGNGDPDPGIKSFAVMVGTEVNGLIIGLSYDQLLHDYVKGLGGMTGFELSLTYVGDYEDDFTFCPSF